jgi:hypothetical protein
LDVTLHFETSAKWPDDFNAIQDVKTAFYLKIADLLVQDQQRYRVLLHSVKLPAAVSHGITQRLQVDCCSEKSQ